MSSPSKLRTLLVLGRVSNVPTVWSNCLAGWLLGHGGDWGHFALLCMGTTLLYVGGMYLNDAFDADFDSQHRRERPIPTGAISEKAVWQIGFGLLLGGLALLAPLGFTTFIFALLLCGSILLYDAIHKLIAFSPVVMALCRFFLYLVAASASVKGVTGLAAWCAVALGFYIMGLSYVARKESTGVVIQTWPQVLLIAPILLAIVVNDGASRESMMVTSAILALWCVRSLRSIWTVPLHIPRAVSGLLAGIVWVDWLAVADSPREMGAAFVLLFLLAVGFQRFVPAT
jgi:hypothetical protein